MQPRLAVRPTLTSCLHDNMGYTEVQQHLAEIASSPVGSLFAYFVILLGAAFFILSVIPSLVRTAIWVYVLFLRPRKNLRKLGQWVVVTGATDGIGKAYAEALAKLGEPSSMAALPCYCMKLDSAPES